MITLLAYLYFTAQGAFEFHQDMAIGLALFDLIFIGLIADGIGKIGDSITIEEMSDDYYERRKG